MTSDLLEENQELRKRNTELQEEISELRNNGFTVSAMTEQQLKVALEKGEQLEKENAELKNKLKHRNCLDCSNHSSNLRMRNLELEKENAELKEKNEGYCRSRDRLISIGFPTFKDCKEYAEHLTKAKEHIRTLISCLIDFVQEGDKDYCYIAEAEQFLKEM